MKLPERSNETDGAVNVQPFINRSPLIFNAAAPPASEPDEHVTPVLAVIVFPPFVNAQPEIKKFPVTLKVAVPPVIAPDEHITAAFAVTVFATGLNVAPFIVNKPLYVQGLVTAIPIVPAVIFTIPVVQVLLKVFAPAVVKLTVLNTELPQATAWVPPSKVTVPEPWLNVPVVFVKLVEIVIVAAVDVNVQPEIVRVPFTSTLVAEVESINPEEQVIPALAIIEELPDVNCAPFTVKSPPAVIRGDAVVLISPAVIFIIPVVQFPFIVFKLVLSDAIS